MTEFTPGPWRVERDGDVVDEYKLVDWPYLIRAADGTKVCNLVECETSEEDARLIAAAPDLYAALKAILDPDKEGDIDMAMAAIRKAEGGARAAGPGED